MAHYAERQVSIAAHGAAIRLPDLMFLPLQRDDDNDEGNVTSTWFVTREEKTKEEEDVPFNDDSPVYVREAHARVKRRINSPVRLSLIDIA